MDSCLQLISFTSTLGGVRVCSEDADYNTLSQRPQTIEMRFASLVYGRAISHTTPSVVVRQATSIPHCSQMLSQCDGVGRNPGRYGHEVHAHVVARGLPGGDEALAEIAQLRAARSSHGGQNKKIHTHWDARCHLRVHFKCAAAAAIAMLLCAAASGLPFRRNESSAHAQGCFTRSAYVGNTRAYTGTVRPACSTYIHVCTYSPGFKSSHGPILGNRGECSRAGRCLVANYVSDTSSNEAAW